MINYGLVDQPCGHWAAATAPDWDSKWSLVSQKVNIFSFLLYLNYHPPWSLSGLISISLYVPYRFEHSKRVQTLLQCQLTNPPYLTEELLPQRHESGLLLEWFFDGDVFSCCCWNVLPEGPLRVSWLLQSRERHRQDPQMAQVCVHLLTKAFVTQITFENWRFVSPFRAYYRFFTSMCEIITFQVN